MSDDARDTRPSRPATSGTNTVAIVVAVVAVLLGFLVLRDINAGDAVGGPSTQPIDTAVATSSTAPQKTTTTLLTEGFEVMVANASGISGSAAKLSSQLKARTFVTVEPVNAAPGTPTQSSTVVYAVPGYEDGAESVASVLGGVEVLPMPSPVPVAGGSLGSASVLVMLGTDLADKNLPKKSKND
jgi:hypothetical protein